MQKDERKPPNSFNTEGRLGVAGLGVADSVA